MWKWIILDGDIDPDWIESLNSVMDDSRVLTLVSNERIPLIPSMRLLFEISSLRFATPATVSRAGILYVGEKEIGWKAYLDSWIESRSDEKLKTTLTNLFAKYVTPDILEYIRKKFKFIVPITDLAMVQGICHLLEGLIEQFKSQKPNDLSQQVRLCASPRASLFSHSCILLFLAFWGRLSVNCLSRHSSLPVFGAMVVLFLLTSLEIIVLSFRDGGSMSSLRPLLQQLVPLQVGVVRLVPRSWPQPEPPMVAHLSGRPLSWNLCDPRKGPSLLFPRY